MKITDLIGMIKLFNQSNIQYFSGVTQRYFEWNKTNIEDYLDGIKYINIEKNRPYLIDSIVTKLQNSNPRFEEISLTDGQQRMTTTYLHICAICAFVKHNDISEEEFDYEGIRDDYLINPRQKGDMKYKLLLREEDRPTLKMIVDELPLPLSTNAGRSKIITAYNMLYNSLTIENYQEMFDKLFYVFTANVIAEEEDDEYIIFNMINGGGKKVSLFTQCKAYSIGKFKLKTQELYDKLYWNSIESNERYKDTIIRSFVLYHNHVDSNSSVYHQFKEIYDSYESVESFHEDLTRYSKCFSKIYSNSFEDKEIKEIMAGLKLIITPARYAVLIKIYNAYEDKIISKSECVSSFNLLLNIGIRRYIYNHKAWKNETRNMFETNTSWINWNDIYGSICKKLKNLVISNTQFENILLSELFYKDANNVEEFKDELETRPSNLNQLSAYLLLRIENAHFGAGRINASHFSLEHVCPKKLNKFWKKCFSDEEHHDSVHMLGNLTLLAKEHNSTVARKDFETKKELFMSDKLYLGKNICSYSEWNSKSIWERTQYLSKELCEIFSIPPLNSFKEHHDSSNQSILVGGK